MCLPGSKVDNDSALRLSSCTVDSDLSNLVFVSPSPLFVVLDTSISRMATRRVIERAMYSNSMLIDAAIECNLDHPTTEHLITSMM